MQLGARSMQLRENLLPLGTFMATLTAVEFSMFTFCFGILQMSLWRFCMAPGNTVVGIEVREDRPRFLLLKWR